MDEMMQEQPWKVLVRTDSEGRIISINSNAFLDNVEGLIEIDSGIGDKYHHAQGNYFDKSIMDNRGIYRYKLVDGIAVERTQEEMDADYHEPISEPSEIDIALVELAALESENAAHLDEQDAALVELAALIVGGV